MPAVAGEGAHLAGPAAGLDRLGPLGADEHVRAVDLVDGGVAGAVVGDLLLGAIYEIDGPNVLVSPE